MKPLLILCLSIATLGTVVHAAPAENRAAGQKIIDEADRPSVVHTQTTTSEPDPFAARKRERIQSASGAITSKTRSRDPFGIEIRGEFKAAPGDASALAASKARAAAGLPGVAATPTFEQAIKNLSIGGINVTARELILGSRSVREGDIIVLNNGGVRFAAWIEKVGADGIMFRDRDHGLVVTRLMRSAPRTPGSGGGAAPLSLEDYFKENPVNPAAASTSSLPVTKNTP